MAIIIDMNDISRKQLAGLAPRRQRAGMTQQQLADLIGVARGTVAMWECGGVWPSARLLPLIAGALLCSIDELYTPPDDEEAEE